MVSLTKTKKVYNWSNEISLDWSLALSNLISSNYSNNLNNFIDQIYLSKIPKHPKQMK